MSQPATTAQAAVVRCSRRSRHCSTASPIAPASSRLTSTIRIRLTESPGRSPLLLGSVTNTFGYFEKLSSTNFTVRRDSGHHRSQYQFLRAAGLFALHGDSCDHNWNYGSPECDRLRSRLPRNRLQGQRIKPLSRLGKDRQLRLCGK